MKFSLGGDRGLAILGAGSPASQKVTCDGSAAVDAVEVTGTAGQSSLTYDAATDQYVYTWKTETAWAGTCRQLIVTLADGTARTASFKFTR